jgi:lipopolysaccharide/colanic/teichoic acid biosynthesis glycosyltransferase
MFAKRILDIVVSGGLIILTLPIMVLTALLVKLDSSGPAVFRQVRVGANRRRAKAFNEGGIEAPRERRERDLGGMPFTMYKFRSMVQEAEEMLPSLVNLGALSEPVYKLDNGPRPEALRVVELYGEKHKRRLLAKPGLTGLQQVACRGTRFMQKRLKYDLHYIKHRSLWLDLLILYKTFFVVIRGNGAH